MKLSEAILLGISVVKNNPTTWFNPGDEPSGCALCTALFAVGRAPRVNECLSPWVYRNIHEEWPWTKPAEEDIYSTKDIPTEISHRHFSGESRESIAKWIASIEPQDEVQPVVGEILHEVK